MKNALTLIAIAGMASVASAQNFSLTISAPTFVDEGAVFTIDVSGDADIGTHMLGGSFSLSSGSGLISNMTWTAASWSSFNEEDGYSGNGDYGSVVFGQLILPGIPPFDQGAPGSELGGIIGSFQITLVAEGTGDIVFSLNAEDPFTLETIDPSNGDGGNSADGNLTLNGATVTVTPAPSALALLGLGGIAAGRRRR